jgi:hypothetical protein
MAFTTPEMSLRVWNLLTDPFDHDQLADNWAKVDQHDHTPGRGVQIPTAGLFDQSVTYNKISRNSLQTTTAAIATLGANSAASTVVNWPTAWADTNYQAYATVNGVAGNLVRVNVIAKTTGSVTVEVRNDSGSSLTGATLQVLGVHT